MDHAQGAALLWGRVMEAMGVRPKAFDANGDSCLSIFAEVYETGALVFPEGAAVLEIGCAEADWRTPMQTLRPDLRLTGIDWRACHGAGTVIRGDVLTQDFPAASFDAIVGISSIEHIGLGHYEHDPLDVDGDMHAMQRAAAWLKPGGWIYADVPYGQQYDVVGTSHRQYDDAALQARLVPPGCAIVDRWFSHGAGLCRREDVVPDQFSYIALLLRKG